MATFEKDFVNKYGSLKRFAEADGCYKIYESDSNYHTVRKPADEQAILNSPFVKNPRLVWPTAAGAPFSVAQRQAYPAPAPTLSRAQRRRAVVVFGTLLTCLGGFMFLLMLVVCGKQINDYPPQRGRV